VLRGSRGGDGPGQGEALFVWGLWAAVTLAVLVTYARLDPVELYHVSGNGLGGGASRALVLANFPVSLVAIGLVLVAAAALPRTAWWVGVPTIALSAVTAWPGVVDQDDLDARWVNALPALGVVLALGLTLAAAKRGGVACAPRLPGDTVRLVAAAIVLAGSLPWLAADAGFSLPGDAFLGEEVPAGEALAAVHIGHHHGLDGALLVFTGLALSRVRPAGRRLAIACRSYVAVMLAYGGVNALQDFWLEQLVKRGWLGWRIPGALEPGLRWIWLVILALALCAGAALGAEARRGAAGSAAGPATSGA
jgi:hypothetical protein